MGTFDENMGQISNSNWVEALFEDAGAVSAPGPLAFDSGMPGTSSAYSIIYAEQPKATLQEAKKQLKEYLEDSERIDDAPQTK